MDKILELIKERKFRIGIGLVIAVTIIAITSYMLLKPKSVEYTYESIEAYTSTFVFEYGEEVDYKVITDQFKLVYGETVTIPSRLNEEQLNNVKAQGEYSYIKSDEIDTSSITHKLGQEQIEDYKKLDPSGRFTFVTQPNQETNAKSLKLEVYYSEDGTLEKKVSEVEIKYAVVDTVPPSLENVQDITIQVGQEIDTSSFKASDPVDGVLNVEVTNTGFDKESPGTYEFTAKAVDLNGLETIKPFKVTVEEEKVAVVDNTSNTPPSTGGNSSSSGSQSQNTGSHGSGNTGSGSSSGNAKPSEPKAYFYIGNQKFHSYCEVVSNSEVENSDGSVTVELGYEACTASLTSPLANNTNFLYGGHGVGSSICRQTEGCRVFEGDSYEEVNSNYLRHIVLKQGE